MTDAELSPASAFQTLRALEIFATLDDAALRILTPFAAPLRLAAGAVLLRQGEAGDAMYVVLSGRLEAHVAAADDSRVRVGRFCTGEPVGEIQAILGGARSATVSAEEDSILLRLPREAFALLYQESREALERVNDRLRERIRAIAAERILPPLLGPLTPDVLAEITRRIRWVSLRRGEALFRQGDPGDAWYVVVSGRLQVVHTDEANAERVVNEVTRGESLGEMALVLGEPRTATPWAVRDSELIRFSSTDFEEILLRFPHVMLSIARVLMRRILHHDTRETRRRKDVCFAIAPAWPGAPTAEVARQLAEALSAIGPTLHLDRQRLAQLHVLDPTVDQPEDHPSWIRFAPWLEDQESRHRFVLLETDPQPTGYTARALRQADHVVIVADAQGKPEPGPIELAGVWAEGTAHGPRRTLLLVHRADTALPSGTARFLAGRAAHDHHHLRLGRPEDTRRVARILAGTAIGLVLGGGGARGFAHIGVLRALEEAGVPIDLIGGTSIGSLMGGQYAMGLTPEAMVELSARLIATRPFEDYTVPVLALLRSERLDRAAKMAFGEVHIEDLWITYFCISSNLTTASMVVHDRGPLWVASRASSSLPAIAVPVVQGSSLLIDGGVLNNLPGDVMRERGAGTVIVVSVSPEVDLRVGPGGLPSSWEALWLRLFRRGRAPGRSLPPSMLDIMMRTTTLASASRARTVGQDADLYLRPPIDRFGMLETERMREIVEVGYEYARSRLADWKERPHASGARRPASPRAGPLREPR